MRRISIDRNQMKVTIELDRRDLVNGMIEYLDQPDMEDLTKAFNQLGSICAASLDDMGLLERLKGVMSGAEAETVEKVRKETPTSD